MGNDKVSDSQLSAHIVDCCPPLQTKNRRSIQSVNYCSQTLRRVTKELSCYKMYTHAYTEGL